MFKRLMVWSGAGLLFFIQACWTHHEVEIAPVEIKPIHITIDVNVKIDRALDDFFGDIDKAEKEIEIKPSGKEKNK